MSSSVKDMLGLSAKEVMEGGPNLILERVHPDDIDRMKKRQEQNQSENVEESMVQDSEFRVKRADGTYIWVNNKRAVVHDSDGKPVAIVGNVRDISVHKHQMEKLDQSLSEKQTLLAEIHHRVKNNLAIVSSLIELQKDEVDPETETGLQKCAVAYQIDCIDS
ncbi:PAS domain-containing protein [Fodinibius sp.]|uniref:PAS domain-containing protein n=1 Tax=Fodinibius sp. TaxID=1872440 RepID=UPI002ACE1BA6|nr:PAS domain-containing protein [Fodinibius sp.]MDZ7660552.1 PAS domain-containing protein [Fodinibius sp.]